MHETIPDDLLQIAADLHAVDLEVKRAHELYKQALENRRSVIKRVYAGGYDFILLPLINFVGLWLVMRLENQGVRTVNDYLMAPGARTRSLDSYLIRKYQARKKNWG